MNNIPACNNIVVTYRTDMGTQWPSATALDGFRRAIVYVSQALEAYTYADPALLPRGTNVHDGLADCAIMLLSALDGTLPPQVPFYPPDPGQYSIDTVVAAVMIAHRGYIMHPNDPSLWRALAVQALQLINVYPEVDLVRRVERRCAMRARNKLAQAHPALYDNHFAGLVP